VLGAFGSPTSSPWNFILAQLHCKLAQRLAGCHSLQDFARLMLGQFRLAAKPKFTSPCRWAPLGRPIAPEQAVGSFRASATGGVIGKVIGRRARLDIEETLNRTPRGLDCISPLEKPGVPTPPKHVDRSLPAFLHAGGSP
jgi:hypothetical protein